MFTLAGVYREANQLTSKALYHNFGQASPPPHVSKQRCQPRILGLPRHCYAGDVIFNTIDTWQTCAICKQCVKQDVLVAILFRVWIIIYAFK